MKNLLLTFSFLVLSSSFIVTKAQNYYIYTYAGNDTAGYSGDGGQATNARLSNPFGVATDASGNLYICDRANNVIRMVNTSGIITTIAGNNVAGYSGDSGPATAAELFNPEGIVVDASGNIYVGDQVNDRVRIFTVAGNINTFAGNGISGFYGDGGPATAAELDYPCGMAADNSGNIYFCEFFNERLRKVNSSNTISTLAGNGHPGFNGDNIPAVAAELQGPTSVAVDNAGNIYIADQQNNRVRKINPVGFIISTLAGTGAPGYSGDGGPSTASQVSVPTGVATDAAGNVYIADNGNDCVRMVNTSGVITTIAGGIATGYSGDGGPATAAEMYETYAVAVDASSGNIYVSDAGNNVVRVLISGVTGNKPVAFAPLQVSLFPDPNNGVFQLGISPDSYRDYQLGINDKVEIYNLLGEKVYASPLNIEHSTFNITIKQPSGIYLYRIVSNSKELASGKFIIQ